MNDSWRYSPRRGCADPAVEPEIFYALRDTSTEQTARETCTACPFRTDCLQHALDAEERHGIWGGVLMSSAAEVREARRAIAYANRARARRVHRTTAQPGAVRAA